jgi:transposase
MLRIPRASKIYLCVEPVDMRKSFDALSGLVQDHFDQNPVCGHLFVFFSKSKDRMKVLVWDINGFVLYYKRLERGTYSWIIELARSQGAEIPATDFEVVLSGLNPSEQKTRQRSSQLSFA